MRIRRCSRRRLRGWSGGRCGSLCRCYEEWLVSMHNQKSSRMGLVTAYPAKYTLDPPEETLQLAQRVLHLSKGVRADTCWHGKAPMVAVIAPFLDASVEWLIDIESAFPSSPFSISSVTSLLSHQSSSVMFLTPHLSNHALLPRGAKKCASGNFFWIR